MIKTKQLHGNRKYQKLILLFIVDNNLNPAGWHNYQKSNSTVPKLPNENIFQWNWERNL